MFQNMDYVYEVCKEKSFSKAAQNLFITQPCLSATIKKAEKRIGMPLFDRSTNPIRLTDCGREYMKYVEKIMALEKEFENYLENVNELQTGQISAGANNVFASSVLPNIISAFSARYPKVRVNLVEGRTAHLEERLFSGELDYVIDNYPLDETVYTRELFCSEHMLLAVPKSFPVNRLLTKYALTFQDILEDKYLKDLPPALPLRCLEREPFILLRSGNDTRLRAERIFTADKIHPRVVLELDQLATAYNVMCNGMGVTFVSDTLARKLGTSEQAVYYKLESRDATRPVYFYRKKTKYVTKAMAEFLNTAKSMHPSQRHHNSAV